MEGQPKPSEPTSAAKSTGVASSQRPTNLAASARSQMEAVGQDPAAAHQAEREILQEVRRSPALPACRRRRHRLLPAACLRASCGAAHSHPRTALVLQVGRRASPR